MVTPENVSFTLKALHFVFCKCINIMIIHRSYLLLILQIRSLLSKEVSVYERILLPNNKFSIPPIFMPFQIFG